MTRTIWIWEITWRNPMQGTSPQHVLALDVNDALARAKLYSVGLSDTVIGGIVCVGYVQVPELALLSILKQVGAGAREI